MSTVTVSFIFAIISSIGLYTMGHSSNVSFVTDVVKIPSIEAVSLWYLTPNSCNCRCIRVLQPDAHKRALLYDGACASAVCPRPAIPGSPAWKDPVLRAVPVQPEAWGKILLRKIFFYCFGIRTSFFWNFTDPVSTTAQIFDMIDLEHSVHLPFLVWLLASN